MSLLAPLFLLGLLAAVITWWLHRLSSNNPPLQDFGSSMFLEASETMSSKQTRLRYLALLSLRILVLALLALLFAEPVFNGIKLLSGGANRHVLIVDTSLSQSHTERWQRTRTTADQIMSEISSADEISVISAGNRLVESGEGDLSATAAQQQINAMQAGLERLDYSKIASSVSAIVSDSRLPVTIHLITDTQQSAMPEQFTDLAVAGVKEFKLYNTASPDDTNTAVTAQLDYAADDIADLSVIISNNSGQDVTRQVTVTAEGTSLVTESVAIGANDTAIRRFTDLDTRDANGRLSIKIDPADDLPGDDTWTVAVPDGERTDISVLQGSKTTVATNYIVAAIESDPRFRKKEIPADSFSAGDAGGVVIVPDAATLSDRASSRLQQFLTDGGSALVIAGNAPHSTQMRKLLSIATTASTSSTPSIEPPGREIRVAGIDTAHPLTSDLSNNWRALSVLRHVPVRTTDDNTPLIELGNGAPLLIERTIGDGKVLILTSALDVSWNSLAIDPLFVAFVIRSIEYLSGDTGASLYRSVGESVSVPPGTQVLNPQGEPLRTLSDVTSRGTLNLDIPGIYTLRSASGSKNLSVNTDPRESNLQAISDESREQWRALTTAPPTETNSTTVKQQTTNKGFWRWLLPLLAMVVLIESLFSHRHLWIKRGA